MQVTNWEHQIRGTLAFPRERPSLPTASRCDMGDGPPFSASV